jgi:RND family efflux transporter MFP subunit
MARRRAPRLARAALPLALLLLPAAAQAGAPCQEPWTGVLTSRQAVDLAANFSGVLARMPVNVGDRLRQNDEVAAFDERALAKDLAMARAGLQAARGEHRRAVSQQGEARRSLERLQRLGERGLGLVAAEEMEKARAAYERASAEVSTARAKVAERQADCGKLALARSQATVRAPFAGVVAARYFAAGEQVPAGSRLVRLIGAGQAILRFAIPEGTREVAVGTPIRACAEGQGCRLRGRVTSVSPEIDPAARLVFVEGELLEEASPPPLGTVLGVTLADRPACTSAPPSN